VTLVMPASFAAADEGDGTSTTADQSATTDQSAVQGTDPTTVDQSATDDQTSGDQSTGTDPVDTNAANGTGTSTADDQTTVDQTSDTGTATSTLDADAADVTTTGTPDAGATDATAASTTGTDISDETGTSTGTSSSDADGADAPGTSNSGTGPSDVTTTSTTDADVPDGTDQSVTTDVSGGTDQSTGTDSVDTNTSDGAGTSTAGTDVTDVTATPVVPAMMAGRANLLRTAPTLTITSVGSLPVSPSTGPSNSGTVVTDSTSYLTISGTGTGLTGDVQVSVVNNGTGSGKSISCGWTLPADTLSDATVDWTCTLGTVLGKGNYSVTASSAGASDVVITVTVTTSGYIDSTGTTTYTDSQGKAVVSPYVCSGGDCNVPICHAVSGNGNTNLGYNTESPDVKSTGAIQGGHASHTGDIIPPIVMDGVVVFDGLNWDSVPAGMDKITNATGQEIWNGGACNGSSLPVIPPPSVNMCRWDSSTDSFYNGMVTATVDPDDITSATSVVQYTTVADGLVTADPKDVISPTATDGTALTDTAGDAFTGQNWDSTTSPAFLAAGCVTTTPPPPEPLPSVTICKANADGSFTVDSSLNSGAAVDAVGPHDIVPPNVIDSLPNGQNWTGDSTSTWLATLNVVTSQTGVQIYGSSDNPTCAVTVTPPPPPTSPVPPAPAVPTVVPIPVNICQWNATLGKYNEGVVTVDLAADPGAISSDDIVQNGANWSTVPAPLAGTGTTLTGEQIFDNINGACDITVVLAATPEVQKTLAMTGNDTLATVALASLAIMFGATAVAVSRRRTGSRRDSES